MNKPLALTAGLLAFGLASGPLAAHHSFAMFDQSRKVSVQGTISEIQWTNPHVWIHVEVPTENGGSETWAIEFTSRVHLTRRGFPKDDIQVGDSGTFAMSPYANGQPGGRFWSLELDKGVAYREPGAQREFEQAQRAAAQQP